MVFGLWMQRFGVGFRGDSGPKAPIVLGTKSFSLSGNDFFCFCWFCFQTHIVCWVRWHCGVLRCWPGLRAAHFAHPLQTIVRWGDISINDCQSGDIFLQCAMSNLREVPKVYQSVPVCTRLYQCVPKKVLVCTRVYQRSTRVYQCVPECTREVPEKYLKCTSQSIRWLTTISCRHLKSSTSANRNGPSRVKLENP